MIAMVRDATTAEPWLLEPARRRYAWGSPSLIPQLLGEAEDGEPLAELWFGAHPAGSASVPSKGGVALAKVVESEPSTTLGDVTTGSFGELPFMVKLIAAAHRVAALFRVPVVVMGHSHRVVNQPIGETSHYFNLGTWLAPSRDGEDSPAGFPHVVVGSSGAVLRRWTLQAERAVTDVA